MSRRGALTAGGLLALLVGGAGTASADPRGQVGTASDPLASLYTSDLVLDAGGDGVRSDGSVVVDVDADDSTTGAESFEVTQDGGATTRLTIPEDGDVRVGEGALDLAGSDLVDGDATVWDGTGDRVPRASQEVPANVAVVAKSGGDYTDVETAVANTAPPALVRVAPGEYQVSGLSVPTGVTLAGAGRAATTLYTESDSLLENVGTTEIRSLTLEQRTTGLTRRIVEQRTATEPVFRRVRFTVDGVEDTIAFQQSAGSITVADAEIALGAPDGVGISQFTANGRSPTLTLVDSTVEADDAGVTQFDSGSTLTARTSTIAGGTNAIRFGEGTVEVAHSQIVGGTFDRSGGSGTFRTFGVYDGSYSSV
jgi:hypothetical protein